MDVIRNIKAMSMNQFCELQVFELIYLLILAFLPFVVALREIAYTLLTIFAIVVLIVAFKKLTRRVVKPEGRVVLITGCDSGFGNACARRLDSHGFTVIACCLDDNSEGAMRIKEAANGHMHVIKLDITNEESVDRCAAKVQGLCGDKGLWALINNAGVCSFGDVEFSSLEAYRRVLEVNIFGTLRMTKKFLPSIRKAKGRVITMTGSTGLLSLPGQSAFCMSNFGLEALNDALRLEVKPFGVEVITIRPGNYAGATGMLNRSGLEKLQSTLDDLKQNTDPDVKRAYGKDYIDNQYTQMRDLARSTAGSLVNVMDAMEDAVGNLAPKSQYLIDGGSQLLDVGNLLIRFRPFVPSSLFDQWVSKLYKAKS